MFLYLNQDQMLKFRHLGGKKKIPAKMVTWLSLTPSSSIVSGAQAAEGRHPEPHTYGTHAFISRRHVRQRHMACGRVRTNDVVAEKWRLSGTLYCYYRVKLEKNNLELRFQAWSNLYISLVLNLRYRMFSLSSHIGHYMTAF